jgi:metal-responsive CopG/Arc/MetJ family transcriptional regulator
MSIRITKANSKPVLVHLPKTLFPDLARALAKLDTDRSKFIRAAIREKLERHGISVSAN